MNAKCRFLTMCAASMFGVVASAAGAATPAASQLYAVVTVDAQGHAANVLPSEQLPGWEHELLMKDLRAWITRPALDSHGKAEASRFVLQIALHTAPAANDAYAANFTVVRTLPIPFAGGVHWTHSNSGSNPTVALVADRTYATSGFVRDPPVPAGINSAYASYTFYTFP